jgi:hypothetical protein
MKEIPVWMASFLSLPYTAVDDDGVRSIRFEVDKQVVRYRADKKEIIVPLGLDLVAGDTVAVYWRRNRTAPTIQVKRAA